MRAHPEEPLLFSVTLGKEKKKVSPHFVQWILMIELHSVQPLIICNYYQLLFPLWWMENASSFGAIWACSRTGRGVAPERFLVVIYWCLYLFVFAKYSCQNEIQLIKVYCICLYGSCIKYGTARGRINLEAWLVEWHRHRAAERFHFPRPIHPWLSH